ncbi:MAG: Casein kinase II subunit beta [Amphiamblys sp. WSBS2006]|nr:MAG: Casein kinase II subunit beta [Amphiamblys sp. WSBS2006]
MALSGARKDSEESDDDFSSAGSWVERFLASESGAFLCEVSEDYILDKFNLVGLPKEVPRFEKAYETVACASECSESLFPRYEKEAKLLYGLVHARYILTAEGLERMKEKYRRSEFGVCPRVLCSRQRVLPCGQSNKPGKHRVSLYCPLCKDIYSAPTSSLDGAYFGKTFPSLFFMTHPDAGLPERPERFVPTVFGFELATDAEKAAGGIQ